LRGTCQGIAFLPSPYPLPGERKSLLLAREAQDEGSTPFEHGRIRSFAKIATPAVEKVVEWRFLIFKRKAGVG
jgi:hypothetical protein